MQKRVMMALSMFGFLVVGTSSKNVYATDVVFDSSVLRELHQEEVSNFVPAPLFPEVKKEPQKKQKIIKKSRKIIVKNNNIKKTKCYVTDAPKGNEKPTISVQKNVDEIYRRPENMLVLNVSENHVQNIAKQEKIVAPKPENNNQKPVEVSVKQEKAPARVISPAGENVVTKDNVVEKISQNLINQKYPTSVNNKISQQKEEILEQQKETTEVSQSERDKTTLQPKTIGIMKTQKKYYRQSADIKNDYTRIKFEKNSDKLTTEDYLKLDNFIKTLVDPVHTMIAINAYNYDNGEDSFSKKRLSLRRIVAVRTYLLEKGYKNFMPKVLTVNDNSVKQDIVEIEEVK